MTDVLNILGNSKCECLTCCDLKDAYHSIPLTERSKEFCGILPYFGSPIYRYEVLPMGIVCAPQIWMDYITLILNDLEQKSKFIAIMDDLLIHSTKQEHWGLVESLMKAMIKNGLKLSPKKCQFFKTNLTYMGNQFIIRNKTMTITPLKGRTEAIQQIPTPRTPKECKSFCGVVNYVSLFCKDLQRLLRPIVELTWKGRPFHWGPEQEKSFRQIKKQLQRPPVLHLPRADGRVILYSDTSREGTGSSLWQVQEGKPRLIGFVSKTLPEACQRYSVTELEMTGLLVNMGLWKSIIRHREFDAAVDHAAVAQILKAKAEPATTCIKCLLKRLASYSFNLYYVKGKDMILADYLSRHRHRSGDPNDLIPISFRLTRPVHIDPINPRCFPMMTRSSAKAVGVEPPPVHGAGKGIDPHKKPEHQKCSSCHPPRHPPRPSAQSALGQLPVPVPRSRSRVQEVARKILDRSKSLQRRSSSWSQPSLSPAAPAGHGESVVVPRAPVPCAHTSSRKPQGTITPQVPLPIGHVPRSSQSSPPDDLIPEEILNVNKYTKQRLQNAQRPIPSIDLGERRGSPRSRSPGP